MKEVAMRELFGWCMAAFAIAALLGLLPACGKAEATAPHAAELGAHADRTEAEELVAAWRALDRARLDEQEAVEALPQAQARKTAEKRIRAMLGTLAAKVNSEPQCFAPPLPKEARDACAGKLWAFDESGAPALVKP